MLKILSVSTWDVVTCVNIFEDSTKLKSSVEYIECMQITVCVPHLNEKLKTSENKTVAVLDN